MVRMICTHCKDSGNFSVSFIPQYDIPFANCEIKLTHKTCGAVVDIKDMIKMETAERSSKKAVVERLDKLYE